MPKDPRVDAYIASKAAFARPILAHLRDLVHARAPGIDETIKWSMPFFTLRGRPLANMAAFKAHASFGMWNRAETETGREGEAMGQLGRIMSLADLPSDDAIAAIIDTAIAALDDGTAPRRAPRRSRPEAEVPSALADALAGDSAARKTWDGFPPGCRREYYDWIVEAKREATRIKRVTQTIAQLRKGKRLNWRYAAD